METAPDVTRPRPARPNEDARQFAIDAARMASASRCNNIAVLDVRGISPITDYFVIGTGTSSRQMRTVAEEIAELGQPRKFIPFGGKGQAGESWIVTDFIDVVVHLFNAESRSYYDLDALWGDAPRVEWQQDPAPASKP